MDTILGIPWNIATPSALALSCIALIIASFVRGWVMSRFAVEQMLAGYKLLVEQANTRAEDYKVLWETEVARGNILAGVVDQLTVVGETTSSILKALPTPPIGDTEKVSR